MKTLSISSGKGGVGKTTVTAHLALALAARGEKVLIFDGDLGMANVDIFFGVTPPGNLYEVLSGKKDMRQILCEVAPGIQLLPGGSGLPELQRMNNFQRRALLDAVAGLPQNFDWLLIDTAPGISENVQFLNAAADEVMVIINPDPSSFTDSYALIKVLHQSNKQNRFSILCNQVPDEHEGFALFRRFQDVVTRFLDLGLDYRGSVPQDLALRKAVQAQRLVMRQDPQAISSTALRAIAARLQKEEGTERTNGGMQGFWQGVVGTA